MNHINGKLYLYGGEQVEGGIVGEMFTYDLSSGDWATAQQGGQTPPPRTMHTACVCYDTFIVVFGGRERSGKESSELVVYASEAGEWQRPFIGVPSDQLPPARRRCAHVVVGASC